MSSSRAYPLRYGGGFFLCCVGIGAALAAVTDLAKANLYLNVGFLVGTLGYFVTWRRAIARCGKPRIYQYLVIVAVIALEFGAFAVLAKAPWFQSLPPYTSQLVVLAVVAVHFMLMYWAFGAWVVRLGVAQLVWLAAAAALSPPVPVVILGFGLVNIVFGSIMAIPILRKAPAPSGGNLPSN